MTETTKAKPTPGPWVAEPLLNRHDWEPRKNGGHVDIGGRDFHGMTCADAALIAEAGTVYHETGLTPREILAQRDELREALKKAEVGLCLCLPTPQFDMSTLPAIRAALSNTKPEGETSE